MGKKGFQKKILFKCLNISFFFFSLAVCMNIDTCFSNDGFACY